MSVVVHKVVLKNDEHFGRKLPPHHLGMLLAELPLAIRASVSMAFRNRSHIKGRRPVWLERASDVRFVDHQGNGESVLFFEAPRLGDAASDIYAQQALFPEADDRPAQEDTAFDLLGDVLADIQERNADSNHYDPSLLHRITLFNRVFKKDPTAKLTLRAVVFHQNHPRALRQVL